MKKKKVTYWLVEADGRVWSDMFTSESECLFHIQDCIDSPNRYGYTEDDYTYRKMAEEEVAKYKD